MKKYSVIKTIICILLMISMICPSYSVKTHAANGGLKQPVIDAYYVRSSDCLLVTMYYMYMAGAEGYTVYCKASGEKKFSKLESYRCTGKFPTYHYIDGLEPGKYKIKLRSYRKIDGKKEWSPYSNIVTVNIPEPDTDYSKLIEAAVSGRIKIDVIDKNKYITMGSFDCDEDGKKEDIKWMVLEVSSDGNKALLLSKFGVARRAFNDTDDPAIWSNSTIRKWLNNDFYKKAFSKAEQRQIQKTKVKNEKNSFYGTGSGPDTVDKLFLMSESELERYIPNTTDWPYPSLKSRICTDCMGSREEWFLRTAGFNEYHAEYINSGGYMNSQGIIQSDDKSLMIRPMMWIELTEEQKKELAKTTDYNNPREIIEQEGLFNIAIVMGEYKMVRGSDSKLPATTTPITWQILDYDEENGKVLVMSQYIIESKQYNKQLEKDINWKDSDLRKWLNNDFYNKAFTREEQALIAKTKISVKSGTDYLGNEHKAFRTNDYLFLLTEAQAKKYFDTDDSSYGIRPIRALFCAQDGNEIRQGMVWLMPDSTMHRVPIIDEGGCLHFIESNWPGGAVCPAMWIDLN